MTLATDDFLAHYGVKGMKWGVRKSEKSDGSPKPLTERKVKKIEKLTAQRDKNDINLKALDAEIDAMPPGWKKSYTKFSMGGYRSTLVSDSERLTKDIDAIEKGKLTSTQKKMVVGAAVVGAVVAYGAVSVGIESGNFNSMALRGKALLDGSDSIFAKNSAFAGYKTGADVAAHVIGGVNPNYTTAGGKMNCRRCTMTYELRRRGYDVQATTAASGWGQSESGLINSMKGAGPKRYGSTSLTGMVTSASGGVRKQLRGDRRKNIAETFATKSASRDDVLSSLAKQPVGARGEAAFNFGRFAHSLAWEKFPDGTYLFDTQKGKSYKVEDEASYSSFRRKWGLGNSVDFTRLDNVALDDKFVSRWATNAKK